MGKLSKHINTSTNYTDQINYTEQTNNDFGTNTLATNTSEAQKLKRLF